MNNAYQSRSRYETASGTVKFIACGIRLLAPALVSGGRAAVARLPNLRSRHRRSLDESQMVTAGALCVWWLTLRLCRIPIAATKGEAN
jgi:hypothetical protein